MVGRLVAPVEPKRELDDGVVSKVVGEFFAERDHLREGADVTVVKNNQLRSFTLERGTFHGECLAGLLAEAKDR